MDAEEIRFAPVGPRKNEATPISLSLEKMKRHRFRSFRISPSARKPKGSSA
jgi:hypothetical protein